MGVPVGWLGVPEERVWVPKRKVGLGVPDYQRQLNSTTARRLQSTTSPPLGWWPAINTSTKHKYSWSILSDKRTNKPTWKLLQYLVTFKMWILEVFSALIVSDKKTTRKCIVKTEDDYNYKYLPSFASKTIALTVPVATSIIVFSSPTYSITIINLTPAWWRSLCQQWAIGLYMGYMVIWAMYGLNDFGNIKFLLLVPLFNCNTNVWPWKMNFSNIYNDIVVKIAEDGPCAEPRSRQPLPHISYHREHTLPASQVSCWD